MCQFMLSVNDRVIFLYFSSKDECKTRFDYQLLPTRQRSSKICCINQPYLANQDHFSGFSISSSSKFVYITTESCTVPCASWHSLNDTYSEGPICRQSKIQTTHLLNTFHNTLERAGSRYVCWQSRSALGWKQSKHGNSTYETLENGQG